MANPVASVTFLQGQAWAKAPDGSLRPLQLGDQLMADEVVVTGDGARIELDFGEGEPVVIAANQEVGLGPDLWELSVTDPSEAQLADASVQQALTILEQGGDLLDSLEEAAAGGGDAGAGGGNSFVQVERMAAAAAEGQEFGYGDPSFANGNGGYGGGDRQNQAPTAQDLQASVAEDTPLNGRILAADPENDALTYTLLTPPVNGSLTLNPATGEFIYQPNENYHGDDSFVVVVTDPRGNSATSTVSLEITPVNDAPISSDQSLQTPEDVPVSGQVVAEDLDGDSLTYSISGNPTNGQVSIDPQTGAFTYTPNPDYHGNDSFVVTIDDGQGGTTTSTINLVVTPVNDAPVASDLTLVTDEDTPISSQVVATDVDGDDLGYTVSTQPTNGTVVIDTATGQFTYTPNQDFNGSDSFIVTVDDGQGGTTTSTVTIGVLPVNDAPVTSNINLVTNEDTPISSQVVATDVDGDSLSYSLSGQPANGSVSLNPATGQFTYTPDASFNGSDSFVVQVSDGNGGVTTSLVTIGVLPLNDAPVAANLNLVTNEDTAISSQVVATDADGDSLSYTLSGQPANGSVSLNPTTGQFTYTPNSNYSGSDSFVVTISDGNGGTTTSTVTIGVTPVNNAPVSADQNLTTTEDTPLNGAISASDVDGDTLAYVVSTGPTNGTLVLNPATGSFVYTPDSNYNGSDSFVVTISDGNGGTTTSTVTIGVTPVNNAPVSADQNLTTAEDTPLDGAIVASDVDGDTLAYSLTTGPANGSLVLNAATGTFTYTPDANYNGSDSFVVTISDGNGGTTTSTINIGVTPVNDAPVSADQNLTTEEDTPLNGAIVASDVDGDTLAYVVSTGPTNGTLVLNPATGSFVYTPNSNYNGSDSFVVTISDGNGGTTTSTVTIGVTPVNNAPVSADQNLTTAEDTPLGGAIVASDVDGDTLAYSLTTGPTNGNLALNAATGTFTYTPNADYNGSDSFVVTISDGNGGTTTSTINIGVTPVNDPPVAADDFFTIDEDTPLVISPSQLLSNDTDVDGNILTVITIQNAENGSISVVGGNILFTPALDYSGPASFDYTISDGNGGFSTATVHITVNPVNDPTVMNPEVVSVAEDSFVQGNVLANDSDPDDVLSIEQYEIDGATYAPGADISIAGVGSFSLSSTGDYSFTPIANYNGPVPVITYTTNTGASSTLTITVTPVNDAPVAEDDFFSVETNDSLVISPAELLANDFDIDGNSLSVSTIFSIENGTISIAGGNITFTPTPGYTGPASFDYSISDGNGGFDTARVHIEVTAAPDTLAPSVVVNIVEDILVAGQTSEVTFTFSEAVTGFELSDLNVTGGVVTNLVLDTTNPDGSVVYTATFTPAADFTGTASVSVPAGSYTDLAGNLGSGGSDSVLALENPNNPPVAVDDFGGPGYSVNLVFSTDPSTAAWNGVDSTGQSVVVQAINANGSIGTFNLAAGTASSGGLTRLGISGTPRVAGSTDAGAEPTQIEYDRISNTSETVMINLNGLADNGTFSISNLFANENGGEVGQWTAYYQGEVVATSAFYLTTGDGGTFTIDTGGMLFDSVGFSALHNRNGTGDGGGYFLAAFSATGPSLDFLVDEGDVLNVSLASGNHLLANDTDPDGDSLSVTHINGVAVTDGSVVTLPSGALLTIFEDGSFTYSPNGAYSGLVRGDYAVDTFEYTVADGLGGTDIGQASVTVVGTADPASTDISSTAGADTLLGTLMADTFVWNLGDEGTAGTPVVDVVQNFSASQGDTLDLRDLLVDENSANLSNYLYAETNGTTTTIHISSSGGFAGGVYDASQTDQVIQLQNVHFHQTGTTSEEIINMLKNAGNLLTD